MQIDRITAWKVELPLVEGTFTYAGGSLSAFDSTVVRLGTDNGMTGWGECSPLGPAYLPAYAEGVRTGLRHLAPHLLGADPTALTAINEAMNALLKGHPYVKSAIDMACWDVLGKAAELPVSTLMGGARGDGVLLYRAVSHDSADTMARRVREYQEAGYRRFQLKLGDRPEADVERVGAIARVLRVGDALIADANGGWLAHEAARVVRALEEFDVVVEQPCATYEECLSIRRRTALPFVLDESIDGLPALVRAHADGAMDMINIKISKFGGLSAARRIRDICAGLGIAMIIEDTCGGDLATAAVAHLAHSTPEALRFGSTDLNGYVTKRYDAAAPVNRNGTFAASNRPGLGVEPDPDDLGAPFLDVGG
jgi:L-alanine-DL-glutamate epimerase-like enolase superfamily enzyme